MKKCVIYTRVSTEMQIDGYSLDYQNSTLEKYASLWGIEICGRYQDAGKSGKSIEGRPAFQKMLKDIQTKEVVVDYVLVFKLSRFGRNVLDTLNSLQKLQKYGTELVSIDEGLDTSNIGGKLILTLLASVSEMERENIRAQTTAGRREKARQGKWNGGPPPYGYDIGEDSVLVVNENERPIVELIFDKYANTDWGFGKIANYLNSIGVKKELKTKNTMPTWSASMLKNLIDNEVYYGKMPYGKRTFKEIDGEEKRVRTDDYEVFDGQHEAIISEELWKKAQEKRKATGIKFAKTVTDGRYSLLTGILKCPRCGSPMYMSRRGLDGQNMFYYYICGRKVKVVGHTCDYGTHLRQDEIDRQVYSALMAMIDYRQFADEIDSIIHMEIDTKNLESEFNGAKKVLRDIENNKRNLEIELDSLSVDVPHYFRKRKDMSERLDVLYDKLEEQEQVVKNLEKKKRSVEENQIQRDAVFEILKNFGKMYEKFTSKEKKQFYNLLIEKIELYEEPLKNGQYIKTIYFKFPIFINEDLELSETWNNMRRVDEDDYLKVKIDVPELNLPPKGTATYNQIRDYVKEHHGVNVTNLYIAQIKTKCGLEMRVNHRVSTKNAPVKYCTKEKEQYIMEALRYFGMID